MAATVTMYCMGPLTWVTCMFCLFACPAGWLQLWRCTAWGHWLGWLVCFVYLLAQLDGCSCDDVLHGAIDLGDLYVLFICLPSWMAAAVTMYCMGPLTWVTCMFCLFACPAGWPQLWRCTAWGHWLGWLVCFVYLLAQLDGCNCDDVLHGAIDLGDLYVLFICLPSWMAATVTMYCMGPLTWVTCMFCLFACPAGWPQLWRCTAWGHWLGWLVCFVYLLAVVSFIFLSGGLPEWVLSSQMVLAKNIRRFAGKPQPKPVIKIVIATTKKSETKLADRGLKQDQSTQGVKKDAYFNQTIQNVGIFFLQLTFFCSGEWISTGSGWFERNTCKISLILCGYMYSVH